MHSKVFDSARLVGLDRRDTTDLSIMMSARGVTELVMLNIGLTLGLITDWLFAMLVVMALVTTFLSSLALRSRAGNGEPTTVSLTAAS